MIKFTWDNMRLYMNGHSVDLPLSVFVPLKDKIRACHMVVKNMLDLEFMIKQGTNWYSLTKTAESTSLLDTTHLGSLPDTLL